MMKNHYGYLKIDEMYLKEKLELITRMGGQVLHINSYMIKSSDSREPYIYFLLVYQGPWKLTDGWDFAQYHDMENV